MPRAVILTALPVEYQAVRTHLTGLREETNSQGTVYERGKFIANGREWEVGIAEVGAGNADAALEAERAIAYFKPDILLFVGIAGGIKDVDIGDVVVATDIYSYESGKVAEQFFTRPKAGKSAYALVQRARAEARKGEWRQRISRPPASPPRAFVAPIAAGEKVIASRESDVFNFIRASYNDAVAVEMEGFGFLSAAFAHPDIKAIVIRGISDLIEGKNDDSQESEQARQESASRHASAFAFQMLTKQKFLEEKKTAIILFVLLCLQIFFPFPIGGGYFPPSSQPFFSSIQKVGEFWIFTSSPIKTNEQTTRLQIFVLSNDYDWKFGSSDKIRSGDEDLSLDWLKKQLKYDQIQTNISKMTDMVAVGTASCEGSPQKEFQRSKNRAIKLKEILTEVTPSAPNEPKLRKYYKLSFGQFNSSSCTSDSRDTEHKQTSSQRRILMIGILEKDGNKISQEALLKALKELESSQQIDFKIEDYSESHLSL